MLNLNLASGQEQPLYLQLYQQIRNQIRSGAIAYGSRLPSIRALQNQLNISKTPIETAYQMLIAEGYAISKPRSGLFVMNMLSAPSSATFTDMDVAVKSPSSPVAPADEQQKLLIDFRASTTDEQQFPLRLWRQMLHHALDQAGEQLCKHGDAQGEASFRSVLADYLRKSRGVQCDPDQIVVGSGIRYSMNLLCALFEDRRTIAYEDPGYRVAQLLLERRGFEIVAVPVRERGIVIEALLETQADAVYVTPSHQFPTGTVMPYSDREQLLHWANNRNAYVIEDDYDGEFRYHGKPIPSLQGLDRSGRVIYIGTFSKAFTPAIRMNYMVLPAELAERARQMRLLLDAPSRIEQWAMQAFIEKGHWFRHIRRMRSSYRKKHHLLLEQLEAAFGTSVQVTGHNAGLHIQLTVRTSLSVLELVELAADEGVGVYDLERMQAIRKQTYSGYPHIYLGFGGLQESQIIEGVRLLHRAWRTVLHTDRTTKEDRLYAR
ncbi:GntR family transcriptional regulator/MocR family aminotransferase [Paenibacillus phyllosphaerae]|uniref:GntR family transcriptional regulator/MocR family aminotransferase n=1 Tax=Paenibacillus phyllosphaerae TaxID=274593 RepID=A0A7W5AYJ9_9BACL|nr:PLP-dependent aminotransferase family protein [Paenibacillus phyllosphaerae]MBB3111140.1 GntR family transcriptional regulator/MocR family aminotransferase [Paenibacillus phyllosphaerae]